MKAFRRAVSSLRAFTLTELLLVIAVIAVLAALLLPALSRARDQARSTSCRNRLRQIGLGLQMYVQDTGCYPPLAEKGTRTLCFDRLYPYYPIPWTNAFWNCPTYIADNGIVSRAMVMTNSFGISYSYNYMGIATGFEGCSKSVFEPLGLGDLPKHGKKEPGIRAPAAMYAVADARSETVGQEYAGCIKMSPWSFINYGSLAGVESAPPHAQGYNILFCDGHVVLVKRSDYLYPPRSASNWNCDNKPHPETWAPANLWTVQN